MPPQPSVPVMAQTSSRKTSYFPDLAGKCFVCDLSGASQNVLGDCSSGHLSLRVWDPVSSSGDAVTASQQGEGMRQVWEEMLSQET